MLRAAEVLALVPEAPTTVELRSLLLRPTSRVQGHAQGGFVVSEAFRVAAVYGAPTGWPGVSPRLAVLAPRPFAWLPAGRAWVPVVVLTRGPPDGAAQPLGSPRPLSAGAAPWPTRPLTGEALHGLPGYLAAELAAALTRGPVFGAFVGGRAVAFATAPHRTARYFSLSVDTLAPFRRQGLGRAAALACMSWEARTGRAPVWAAEADNAPSLALARGLGFTPAGTLFLATAED